MTETENDRASEEDIRGTERQEEFAARYPWPLPGRGDRIFVKDTDSERMFLHESLCAPYVDGYRWAADILLRHIRSSREERKRAEERDANDIGPIDQAHWLVYPIYFSFRQSVELSLKGLLAAQEAEQRLPADAKDLRNTTHDLQKLWKPIKPWAMTKLHGSKEAAESFTSLIDEIHAEDERGDAGRFAERKVGKKQCRPSFEAYAPLSLDAIESAGVKMLNYLQRIWSAIEDEKRDLDERASARSQDSEE